MIVTVERRTPQVYNKIEKYFNEIYLALEKILNLTIVEETDLVPFHMKMGVKKLCISIKMLR